MDLTQRKLSKEEWESIETPISPEEKTIVKMIVEGAQNVNIKTNTNQSLFSFVKIEISQETHQFLYTKYFEETVQTLLKKYLHVTLDKNPQHISTVFDKFLITKPTNQGNQGSSLKRLKSADNIRIQNLEANIKQNTDTIYEFLLLDLAKNLLNLLRSFNLSSDTLKKKQNTTYAFYLYTLIQLQKNTIQNINNHVQLFVNTLIKYASEKTQISIIIKNAYEFIEKNPFLLKYEDRALFSHQKQLFQTFIKNPAKQEATEKNPETHQKCESSDKTLEKPADKSLNPKLVLYSAPTGTGKTLSPLGLAQNYRIIFVCVARHIGLALAKSAISAERKVAFAFGCETASDIRLHYFSAVNYVKHYKSGAIAKVDNSEGSKVEIMICDVQSYLTAMHYMLAFNKPHQIIMYWDEPTITMDYETHDLHATIQRNWRENKIPNMVLSCATLPNEDEIYPVIQDYKNKCGIEDSDQAELHAITSFDCKKSIPILNKDGYCVLPHMLYENYDEMRECVDYCSKNQTLLRYFDLQEIIRAIEYINNIEETKNLDPNQIIDSAYTTNSYFESIDQITMNSLKIYYLELLKHVEPTHWPQIYEHLKTTQQPKFKESFEKRSTERSDKRSTERSEKQSEKRSELRKSNSVENNSTLSLSHPDPNLRRTQSVCILDNTKGDNTKNIKTLNPASGIQLTTNDAYTLTDGPTIFLCQDVNKIGTFYIQQSKISPTVFQMILAKISKNNEIVQQIQTLESQIQEKQSKSFDTTAKNQKSGALIQKSNKEQSTSNAGNQSDKLSNESQKFMDEINRLRKEIRMVSLDPTYVPNTKPHQEIWTPTGEVHKNAFVPSIDEDTAKTIMTLDIENNLKVLLLLGIGLFTENPNIHYMEIMKRLADAQRLFIIIASSDYIYGTNYQFCHGFIAKDIANMTQQKTMQAMGRIGRNNIQQDYSVRFRDDQMIYNLFKKPEENMEAINMCRLLSSED